MAAKISVLVPWPSHIGDSASPKKIIIQFFFFLLATTLIWGSTDWKSFFFFWQLRWFGGLLTENLFFSKLGKLILNFVEYSRSHTWEWKVVWAERVLKTNLNKSTCLPYEHAEISHNCPHKNIFREDIRGLCWQGRLQRTNIFFLLDYMYSISSLFWVNLPELTSQVYSRCSFLKIVDFNWAFKKLSSEICLNRIRRERLV